MKRELIETWKKLCENNRDPDITYTRPITNKEIKYLSEFYDKEDIDNAIIIDEVWGPSAKTEFVLFFS